MKLKTKMTGKMKQEEFERVRNKVLDAHIATESKKADIEVERNRQKQKIEEKAAQHRSANTIPSKFFGIFKD